MLKGVNGLIFRCIFEIVTVVTMLFISYCALTNSRVASTASIVKSYGNANIGLMSSYDRTKKDGALDSGTLTVKNPNSHTATAIINLKVSLGADLTGLKFVVNDKELDNESALITDNYYVIPVEECEMTAYGNTDYDLDIFITKSNLDSFAYIFDVNESF